MGSQRMDSLRLKEQDIAKNVSMIACLDWDRRLFDSLIPLPDGTSYNSYLIKGSEGTMLIDTTDPTFSQDLLSQLDDVKSIDYIVSSHSEQDHSGTIPLMLERYGNAKLIATKLGKPMLMSLLHIPEERFKIVEDGETISLGDKTLKFIYTPWVHWPETMVSYLIEDKILFSCDFFGSHLATTETYANEDEKVYEAAKRYYAEIMMPFRKFIQRHLAKLEQYDIRMIAPSHGPAYNIPAFIVDAYKEWVDDKPKNEVVVPYVSMHESTKKLVDRLAKGLSENGIKVHQFDLAAVDLGELAIKLVDAATIVIGAPTVRDAPHPNAMYALNVANAIVPKAKYAAVLNSYGWGNKSTIEAISNAVSGLNLEVVGVVAVKGLARPEDYQKVDELATKITEKHRQDGLF